MARPNRSKPSAPKQAQRRKRQRPSGGLTVAELARQLGITRQALEHHLKNPEHPAMDDLPAWTTFLAAVGRERTVPQDMKRALAIERHRLLQAQASRAEAKNAEDSGRLIDRGLVTSELQACAGELFGTLERILCGELPPVLVGLDEIEIRLKIRETLDGAKEVARQRLLALGNVKKTQDDQQSET